MKKVLISAGILFIVTMLAMSGRAIGKAGKLLHVKNKKTVK